MENRIDLTRDEILNKIDIQARIAPNLDETSEIIEEKETEEEKMIEEETQIEAEIVKEIQTDQDHHDDQIDQTEATEDHREIETGGTETEGVEDLIEKDRDQEVEIEDVDNQSTAYYCLL